MFFIIIRPIWTVSAAIVSAGVIRYWGDMYITPCSHRKIFAPKYTGFSVWFVIKGPIVLPFLFVSQLRILIIGSSQKLRLWRDWTVHASIALPELQRRAQAVECLKTGVQPRIIQGAFRIVWSSVLASMAVVMMAFSISCPALFVALYEISTVSVVARAFNYLANVEHCYAPLIYVCLFPHYRRFSCEASEALKLELEIG
ncbi:hypothetical protein BV898_09781 [Hypsibius exemplaris]|uniref:Uncharacterized protein n=1 Tax=Hypsibius exemplaris TaxID=2072580 RepID=A0A1W0WLQ9_HYPEX|nr:hypothetical protein BV898_09781 [Hypsibius exemplaris]